MSDPVVIASYARTPMCSLEGGFASVKCTDLGAAAIKAAVERAALPAELIECCYMGCVLPAGLGQAPARQAVLAAGLPKSVSATTVNKMCGSGMQAVMMAYDALAAGSADVVVAGGMESMTNAPYLLSKFRSGARFGHDVVQDSMALDGLEDAYEHGVPMGALAERSAENYGFSRQDQDAYALESLKRAQHAIDNGLFIDEIAPVEVATRKGTITVDTDEQPGKARPEKIPGLKPAFTKDGTITAANASSISDGAAALVMTRQSVAKKLGLKVVARIAGTAAYADEPALFPSAPVPAMKNAMEKAGWTVDDVDLFEVNEAFAVVAMIAMYELGLPRDKVNVNGGACALGHPIGASGARILATLLSALKQRGLKRGLAGICIGGGEATAVALELL